LRQAPHEYQGSKGLETSSAERLQFNANSPSAAEPVRASARRVGCKLTLAFNTLRCPNWKIRQKAPDDDAGTEKPDVEENHGKPEAVKELKKRRKTKK